MPRADFRDCARSMKIAGVIIAGGKGMRLGGDKPLHAFGRTTLLETIIDRVKPQVEALAINVPRDAVARYRAHLGDDFALLCDDEPGDIGPLAGILSGLRWAEEQGAAWLATFPADTPFLPRDLVPRLLAASRDATPVGAHDGYRLHGLCAVWPIRSHAALCDAVRNSDLRSLRAAITHLGGGECIFEDAAPDFMNVNTPEDLREAERILAQQPR